MSLDYTFIYGLLLLSYVKVMKLDPLKLGVIVYSQPESVVAKDIAYKVRLFCPPFKSILYYIVDPVELNIAEVQFFIKFKSIL